MDIYVVVCGCALILKKKNSIDHGNMIFILLPSGGIQQIHPTIERKLRCDV